jgi:UDP-glucose 4-epimerase
MRTKRALITGATGFLGGYTIQALLGSGFDVVALKRASTELPGVRSVVVDFDDVTQLKRLFMIPRCNVVIHLASNVDLAADASLQSFYPTQVLATTILAALSRSWKAHFVLASSVAVHGDREEYGESTGIAPSTAYGRSKYLAELILASAGVPHTILRFGGIFGLDGPRHLGLNVAITEALENDTVPTIHGSGSGRRNYMYVKDAARAVVTAAEDKIAGTHLIAGKERLSIAEMLWALTSTTFNDEEPRVVPNGNRSRDQVIQPSSSFPVGRTFIDALADIVKDGKRP